MGLFGSKEFNTLEDLFCHQLEDLYDAFEATLNEEKATDAKLTQLAEGTVNPQAV